MKFSVKDFFRKCDQIRRKLQVWSYLLKKSLMENFIFCVQWDLNKPAAEMCELFSAHHTLKH